MVWIIDYAGTVEELGLGSVTSGIVLIGGMVVGGGVEGVRGKGEIRMRGDGGGSSRVMVVNWDAAETGKGDGAVGWVVEEVLLRGKNMVERESWVVV